MVSLFAADNATGEGTGFTVVTETSNGLLELSFPSQPLKSTLIANARTSNKGVEVGLHPAYEGVYTLRTSNAKASLVDEQPEDPSGEGRTRHVDQKVSIGRLLDGYISWDGKEDKKSFVSVQSSNSPVTLTLQDA